MMALEKAEILFRMSGWLCSFYDYNGVGRNMVAFSTVSADIHC